MKKHKLSPTATEVMLNEANEYYQRMNWLMAKALVEGKVSSGVLSYAEEVYESLLNKYLFEKG